jgi:hypothetical protein
MVWDKLGWGGLCPRGTGKDVVLGLREGGLLKKTFVAILTLFTALQVYILTSVPTAVLLRPTLGERQAWPKTTAGFPSESGT